MAHMFQTFLTGTLRFELRTQMQNATVDVLSKNNANKVNTDKSSRNNCEKKFQNCLILLHYVGDNPGQGTH